MTELSVAMMWSWGLRVLSSAIGFFLPAVGSVFFCAVFFCALNSCSVRVRFNLRALV